jgi:hypothetical protein
MAKPKPPFTGRWRIVSMSAWDQDFVDEEEEGFNETTFGNGRFLLLLRLLTGPHSFESNRRPRAGSTPATSPL